uniref:Bcl-2 Bcl-2 homology region 1-3 domain-containing protein n=1 Tax=Salmo trutta TaxID=8032 RepID=A0A674CZY3_SALTR
MADEACGAAGGKDAVILRGYVIERFRAEGIQMSPEELGGTPNELQGDELNEMVDGLLETTEEINTNAELQRLISEVPVHCIQDVFFATTKEIFTDGINFGKVAALYHLAYKLIHRAHTQNQPQVMVNIINWTQQFIREYISIELHVMGKLCFIDCNFGDRGTICCIIVVAVAFKVGYMIYHLKGNVRTFIQVILMCTLEVKVLLA